MSSNNNNTTTDNNDNNNDNERVHRGRQKIPIAKIENENHLQVTFSKRRNGLFKKANELSTLCGVDIGIMLFSPSKKLHTYASPSMDSILRRYDNEKSSGNDVANEVALSARLKDTTEIMNEELNKLEDCVKEQKKVYEEFCEAEKQWPSISELSLEELELMKHRLEILRAEIVVRLDQNIYLD